jgi:hypothetical protein
MKKFHPSLRWALITVLLVLLFGCSTTQKAPVTANLDRDSQISASSAEDSPIALNPYVEYLGKAVDPQTGKIVEGYMFRHPDTSKLSPTEAQRYAEAITCYGFLATGAKWKVVEPWVLNAANNDGLTSSFLLANETLNISKWEDAADGVVGDGLSINILGNGTLTTSPLTLSNSRPDGVNAVFVGGGLSSGTIAITVIWGVFSGATSRRQLTEWDQEFNDTNFTWTMTGEAGKMDFENISTHELGHACGLNDQYSSSCSAVSMYGYGANGETKKRTLEAPDITGISTLY